jgi:hypothetical protein
VSTSELPEADRFSFRVRPVAVPGELRISWRLAVITLMLHHCRQQRASLIKLHILNDVIRSPSSASLLQVNLDRYGGKPASNLLSVAL